MRSNLIDLEARLVHETDKARLLDFGGDKPVWLSKSGHEWEADDGVVTLPEQMAIEKGIV